MTPLKAREIANDLIEGDSCCDKSAYLEDKVSVMSQVILGDSLDLINSNKNLIVCEQQAGKYRIKEILFKQEIDIRKAELKRVKSQRIKIGIGGGLVGFLLGVISR